MSIALFIDGGVDSVVSRCAWNLMGPPEAPVDAAHISCARRNVAPYFKFATARSDTVRFVMVRSAMRSPV